MQFSESGVLSLDDETQLETLCPELKDVRVAQDNRSAKKKTARFTLRMLMTHTAGFGYSFLDPKHRAYCQRTGKEGEFDEFSGQENHFQQPLVNNPCESFVYGISIDWVGIAIERVRFLNLNDYMQSHIFEPLGIQDITMYPSDVLHERLLSIWQQDNEGRLAQQEFPLKPQSNKQSNPFFSGGAGFFGRLEAFSEILATLLNDGVSPATAATILHPTTIKEMFRNKLEHWPNFARQNMLAVKPDLVYLADALYPPCEHTNPQGWGLSFLISPGSTGRSDSMGSWSGLSNIFLWCAWLSVASFCSLGVCKAMGECGAEGI